MFDFSEDLSINTLLKWLKIREENGISFPTELIQFEIDIRKSALLTRMLGGKDPLPEPPPKAFSYPWYSLIEQGEGDPFEVVEVDPFEVVEVGKDLTRILIDQHIWDVIKKISDTEYQITYNGEQGKFRWKLWRPDTKESDITRGWKIKRS